MSKKAKDSGKEALDAISQILFEKIRDIFTEDSLQRLPPEVVIAVCNLAIFKALKMLNFPMELMDDATAEEIQEFDDYANSASHILIEYCEGLREWRPYPKN